MAAAQATGLEATSRGSGPFTVFAPRDAAFARLPQGIVQELRKPEIKPSSRRF
ncbi:MAG: fasciclin domain-containing protein [Bryobacteraceae bacterium]